MPRRSWSKSPRALATCRASWPNPVAALWPKRAWVYLDMGRFSGLAETEGEAIRYQFETPRDGDPTGPCIMAGPSCDSADVLYEKRPMLLPISLRAGDRVLIRNTGAYTSTYSSVCFNGFPPLAVVVI